MVALQGQSFTEDNHLLWLCTFQHDSHSATRKVSYLHEGEARRGKQVRGVLEVEPLRFRLVRFSNRVRGIEQRATEARTNAQNRSQTILLGFATKCIRERHRAYQKRLHGR